MRQLLIALLISILGCGHAQAYNKCIAHPEQALHTKTGQAMYWLARDMKFHLRFVVDPTISSEVYLSIYAAALTWNEVLGHEVFTFVPKDGELYTSVPILFSKELYKESCVKDCVDDPNTLARTAISFAPSGRMFGAHMEFRHTVTPDSAGKLALHEMGHLLGLNHDPWDKDSIMYPGMRDMSSTPGVRMDDLAYITSMLKGGECGER